MTALPHLDQQAASTAFARRRDTLLLWLVARHPVTAGMLAELGLFPTVKKARKRLARLRERRLLRCVGTVALKEGRPEQVFAKGRWKADTLLHEVQLTRVCLKIFADDIRRGAGEVDPLLLPDAELFINGRRYFLEMDMGTMSYPEIVRTRFSKYCEHAGESLVLWVCPSESRMEGLRQRAGSIRGTALFATLDRALADPHAPVWVDFDGQKAALPRGGHRGNPLPALR